MSLGVVYKEKAKPEICNGLLIVGDPHISSIRPGRREETDWPRPIMRKLEKVIEIANENDYQIVMLGDLFHEAVERDEALKTRVTRLFRTANRRILTNLGNHDMDNIQIGDGDTLTLIATSDTIDVCTVSGPIRKFLIDGKIVGLGMTPYGQIIPHTVKDVFGKNKIDEIIWLTHHDIAFNETYPGAIPPHLIAGCDVVINGHIHAAKPAVTINRMNGKTCVWHNPGNISRLSLDLANEIPRAHLFRPNLPPTYFDLPYEVKAINQTGSIVDKATSAKTKKSIENASLNFQSQAISMLAEESKLQMPASQDGSLLLEDITAKFEKNQTKPHVRAMINALLKAAINEREEV